MFTETLSKISTNLLPLVFQQRHLGTPFFYAHVLVEIEFYEILLFFQYKISVLTKL